jgi:hypothetical protein
VRNPELLPEQDKATPQIIEFPLRPADNTSKLFLGRKYLRQVAITGGVQSCFLTSFLNGAIEMGRLKFTEAKQVQDHMVQDSHAWFSPSEDHPLGMRKFNKDIEDIRWQISKMFGLNLPVNDFFGHKFPNLDEMVKGFLAYGYSLVVTDERHSVLAARMYPLKNSEDQVMIIDPMKPNSPYLLTTTEVANYAEKNTNGYFVLMQ